MVAIPKSPGILQRPSTQVTSAKPNLQQELSTAKAISELGGDIADSAVKIAKVKQAEDDAFKAAKAIDFKTQLSKFDNEKRIQLNEIPSSDLTAIQTAKDSILKEREAFIQQNISQEKDPELSSLFKRQADASSVDFTYDADRVLSNKKKEYGQGKIFESIYNINTRLGKVTSAGEINSLKRDLEETVQVGLKTGLLDVQDVIREREKQAKIIEDRKKEFEASRLSTLVSKGGYILNYNDSKDKKLGDEAFAREMQLAQSKGLNPDSLIYNFIQKTSYVPTEVKRVWSSNLTAGTPEQKITTANKIAELLQSNVRLQDQFSSDDISYTNSIRNKLDSGLSPKEVIDYVDNEVSKMKSLDYKAKNDLFDSKDYRKTRETAFADVLEKISDQPGLGLFKSSPYIPAEVKSSFDSMVKDQLVSGKYATPEGAINFAKDKIAKEWGVTSIGKKRLMRFAPETFFQKYDPDTSWIKGQMASKIAENELVAEFKKVETNYDLVPEYNLTSRGLPAYRITKINEFGQSSFVLDSNNQPVVFVPDYTKTSNFKNREKDMAKFLGKNYTKEDVLKLLEERNRSADTTAAISLGSKLKYMGQ